MTDKKRLMDEIYKMPDLLGGFVFAIIVVGGSIAIIVAFGTIIIITIDILVRLLG